MTNQGLVVVGAVLMAASFGILFVDGKLFLGAFVNVGGPEGATVGEISDGSALKIFVWVVVFGTGAGLLVQGFRSNGKSVIRKRH